MKTVFVTPPIPRVSYCMQCGSRLVRHHYRWARTEETSYSTDAVEMVEVPEPYCIYDKVHEAEKRGRRR